MEEWRDIEGYEGLYQVSNEGRVKSLARVILRSNGRQQHVNEKILKYGKDNGGYYQVCIQKDGSKQSCKVHKLVANAFIPNPNGYNVVHHKDHNRQNNFVENLEWIDEYKHRSMHYNEIKEYITEVCKKVLTCRTDLSKKVEQIDPETMQILRIWGSTRECGRNGYDQSHVASCCRGETKIHKGFIWRYA
jgi:hypothetical protein